MRELFKKRLALHQRHMQKYLRYVFNDHFVLICVFLLGGVGLYYSEFVKSLPRNFWPAAGVALLILVAILPLGRFATLMQEADIVFLLPKERALKEYFKGAFNYSLLLPFFIELLVLGFLMPLLVATTAITFPAFFILLGTMWLLKLAQLKIATLKIYQVAPSKLRQVELLWLVLAVLCLAAGIFLNPFIGLILAFVTGVGIFKLLAKSEENLDWEKMIGMEKSRLHRIYQFINLFTDVPEITATVKRRAYLDGVLQKIKPQQKNTYLYLYARRFARGSEYSGLFIRLVVIGSLLLYFVQDVYFSLGLGILFIYMIGFQLIPLYNQFRYMILTQLYPVSSQQKAKALQVLLLLLLSLAAFVFAISASLALSLWYERFLVIAAYFLMVFFFTRWYVPRRLKKMA